jgi:hypothetical protein
MYRMSRSVVCIVGLWMIWRLARSIGLVVRSFAKSPDCADTRIGSPYRIVRSLGGSDSPIDSIRSITRSASDGSVDSRMVRAYPMMGRTSDRVQISDNAYQSYSNRIRLVCDTYTTRIQ